MKMGQDCEDRAGLWGRGGAMRGGAVRGRGGAVRWCLLSLIGLLFCGYKHTR